MGRATYDMSERNEKLIEKKALPVRKFDGEYPIRFENELFVSFHR